MALIEFHDTLLPVVLDFSGNIGNESLCGEISPIPAVAASSPTSPFDNLLKMHSPQGFVTVDLHNNFLNILKIFLAVANDFTKSLL
jgi:hypothetical protein